MNKEQALCLVILIPFILIYSIVELRRAWKILKKEEASLNFVYLIRIGLIKLIWGSKRAEKYRKDLLKDMTMMNLSGLWSMMGGILGIIVCIFWVWVIYKYW